MTFFKTGKPNQQIVEVEATLATDKCPWLKRARGEDVRCLRESKYQRYFESREEWAASGHCGDAAPIPSAVAPI
jgi:hypothetical protein